MVEAKLRVEMIENKGGSKNPFYGSTMVKKVVEDTLIHDFDKRVDIAPCGIYATIAIDSTATLGEGDKKTKRVFDIKVDRHYFDHDDNGGYLAFFSIEEKVYELFVAFSGKHITNVVLSEWLSGEYFENGDDADNIYRSNCFASIEELES